MSFSGNKLFNDFGPCDCFRNTFIVWNDDYCESITDQGFLNYKYQYIFFTYVDDKV